MTFIQKVNLKLVKYYLKEVKKRPPSWIEPWYSLNNCPSGIAILIVFTFIGLGFSIPNHIFSILFDTSLTEIGDDEVAYGLLTIPLAIIAFTFARVGKKLYLLANWASNTWIGVMATTFVYGFVVSLVYSPIVYGAFYVSEEHWLLISSGVFLAITIYALPIIFSSDQPT